MDANGIVVYDFKGVNYLLRDCLDDRGAIANPNFKGTKLALIGILKHKESVQQFVDRINGMKVEINRRAAKAISKYESNMRKDAKMQH